MKLWRHEGSALDKSTSQSWIKNWHQLLQSEPRSRPPPPPPKCSWGSHPSGNPGFMSQQTLIPKQLCSLQSDSLWTAAEHKEHDGGFENDTRKKHLVQTPPALLANNLTDVFSHCCHWQLFFFCFCRWCISEEKKINFDRNKALHLLIWSSPPLLPWKHFTHSLLLNTLCNEENREIRNLKNNKKIWVG